MNRKKVLCIYALMYATWIFALTMNECWGWVRDSDTLSNVWETTGHFFVFNIICAVIILIYYCSFND